MNDLFSNSSHAPFNPRINNQPHVFVKDDDESSC